MSAFHKSVKDYSTSIHQKSSQTLNETQRMWQMTLLAINMKYQLPRAVDCCPLDVRTLCYRTEKYEQKTVKPANCTKLFRIRGNPISNRF